MIRFYVRFSIDSIANLIPVQDHKAQTQTQEFFYSRLESNEMPKQHVKPSGIALGP